MVAHMAVHQTDSCVCLHYAYADAGPTDHTPLPCSGGTGAAAVMQYSSAVQQYRTAGAAASCSYANTAVQHYRRSRMQLSARCQQHVQHAHLGALRATVGWQLAGMLAAVACWRCLVSTGDMQGHTYSVSADLALSFFVVSLCLLCAVLMHICRSALDSGLCAACRATYLLGQASGSVAASL
jgi:hypothetical protein